MRTLHEILPWSEIVRLYRLTLDYEINKNTAPAYNIAPTVEVPFVTEGENGDHTLREGRWWLVPWWGEGDAERRDVQCPMRNRRYLSSFLGFLPVKALPDSGRRI